MDKTQDPGREAAERTRRIELCLEGEGIGPGRAPLNVLLELLKVTQDSIYAIGRYELDQSGWTTGRISAAVKTGCRLDLIGLNQGSAVAVLELPEPSTLAYQLDLAFPQTGQTQSPVSADGWTNGQDFVELGERSIQRYGQFLEAVASGDIRALHQSMPDAATRNKLLWSLQKMSQWTESGIVTSVMPGEGRVIRVDQRFAGIVAKMIHEPDTGAVSVVGKMVLVQLEPSRYFRLSVDGRRVNCHYPSELDQAVIEGLGQIVEVTGEAVFDEEGEPRDISVEDLKVIDLVPITLKEVNTRKGIFRFTQPMRFDLAYGDGLLIANNQEFHVVSFGRNRDELLHDIAVDLEELWRAYVEEPVDQLTEGAVQLRRRLQERIHIYAQGE